MGGASRGLRTAIHPEYNPKIVLSNCDYRGFAKRLQAKYTGTPSNTKMRPNIA